MQDVARFGYDLYGVMGPRLLSNASRRKMVPGGDSYYGFAAFNLTLMGISGQSSAGPFFKVYGHLGATYGFDSILAYYPGIDVALAIGTDIETNNQMQPSETMCYAYNAVLSAMTGTPEPRCTFDKSEFYGGRCECGNNYACSKAERKCVQNLQGSLSKSDCEQAC